MSRGDYISLGYYPLSQARDISDFNLIDHRGDRFESQNLKGHWSLLFFGYTYCPDVCPVTLAVMNKAIKLLEPEIASKWQIALVSVDPERDTPEILADYVPAFNKKFIGVTGEFDEIVKLATQLNIAFGKVPGEEPGSYLVDHSASIVVISPDGRYQGFFKPPHQPAKIASVMHALASP